MLNNIIYKTHGRSRLKWHCDFCGAGIKNPTEYKKNGRVGLLLCNSCRRGLLNELGFNFKALINIYWDFIYG